MERRRRFGMNQVLRRQHAAAHLAELDGAGPPAQHDLVAVLEEGARAAVRERDRLGAVQRQLHQRALAPVLGAGDRPRGHQVAGADRGAVRGGVRELLRQRPVERARVRRARRPSRSARARARGRAPSRGRRRDTASGGGSCGGASTRLRRAARAASPTGRSTCERLAEERPERHVLLCLDVARAPVVHEHDAEDVLGEALDRHRLARRARHADDEAELELDVEPR